MRKRFPKKLPRTKTTKKAAVSTAVKKYVDRKIKNNIDKGLQFEYSNGGIVASDTTNFVDLTDAISQGDGETDRNGDNLVIDRLKGRYVLSLVGGATAVSGFRIMVFKWKPDSADDAPTAMNEFFQNNMSTMNTVMSNYVGEINQRGKFTPLYDRSFILTPEDGAKNYAIVKYDIRTAGTVHFNAGASSGRGKVYMLIYGTNPYSAGTGTQFGYLTGDTAVHYHSV